MQKEKENIFNIPNALTLIRILLIPLYFYLIMGKSNYIGAIIVFVTASCTDLLDGYIARKYKLITNFGKLVDPLADKLLVSGVMLSLILTHLIPLYMLLIMIVKELIMVLGGLYMYKKGIVVYSKTIGKIAQATLVLALALSLLGKIYAVLAQPAMILLYCGMVLTVAALVFYTISAAKQLRAAQ
jgi:CDP-diacylglycerol--glycerol-3-phosphate 3-phosphatidyltransferase